MYRSQSCSCEISDKSELTWMNNFHHSLSKSPSSRRPEIVRDSRWPTKVLTIEHSWNKEKNYKDNKNDFEIPESVSVRSGPSRSVSVVQTSE